MSSTANGPDFDDQEKRIFDQLQLLFERGLPYVEGGEELKAMNQDSAWCETVDRVVLKLTEYQSKTKHAPVVGPDVTVEDQLGGWYVPGGKHDLFWPSLERHLRSQEKWRDAVDSIDRSSRLVTSLLGDPHANSSKVRDLGRQEQISARKVARNQLLRAGFARKLPEPTAHDGARKALQINAFGRRASNRSQLGKLMFCH